MREGARGAGERAETLRRRKRYAVVAVLFTAGLVTGWYAGHSEQGSFFSGEANWDPTVSLVLTAMFLITIVGGSLVLHGSTDEVQRQAQFKATAIAGGAYMLLYPAWFMLWKGGHVAEPQHGILFVVFWLCLAGASIWYRFR
jgi:hypothetical protein